MLHVKATPMSIKQAPVPVTSMVCPSESSPSRAMARPMKNIPRPMMRLLYVFSLLASACACAVRALHLALLACSHAVYKIHFEGCEHDSGQGAAENHFARATKRKAC